MLLRRAWTEAAETRSRLGCWTRRSQTSGGLCAHTDTARCAAAARRQAQEMLAAQGLDKGGRDESLAPSDASEQMHVELVEGGPILSMRITRSQHAQQR